MKDLSLYIIENIKDNQISESKGQSINQRWLDSKKPVMTKDGRNVLIEDIDYSVVPNIIKGKVAWLNKSYDFEWNDTGECINAQDKMGNPCAPNHKTDDLVRAV